MDSLYKKGAGDISSETAEKDGTMDLVINLTYLLSTELRCKHKLLSYHIFFIYAMINVSFPLVTTA